MASALGYVCFFLTLALIYGTICLGLNLQWGAAGLFNVGVAGFVGTGAYVCAWLTAAPAPGHWGGFALPIPLGWLGAMAGSAALSAVVGAVTLRLRADYLAIATFGAAASLQLVMLNAQRLTGGPFGIALIPRPFAALAPRPLAFAAATLALVAGVVAVLFAALERLTHSPWGRALRAVREDETAAASLGKSPAGLRLQAFVLGGAIMGLGGAMQAQFFGFIAPENFLPALTFLVWVMLVVGGAGSNRGALLGAVVVWALWTLSGSAVAVLLDPAAQARGASLRLVVIGAALAAMVVWRPRGLLPERATVSRHVTARGLQRPGRAPPAGGQAREDGMFIAMNRFRVLPGSEGDFEHVWLSRETHLEGVPGFVEFHLLRGPAREDYVLYSSHTIWRDRSAFEAWTTSDAFRAAHRGAGGNKPLYLGHPEFEGFDVLQTVRPG